MAKIFTQQEIEKELLAAEIDNKFLDLSNRIIQEINLSEREIKTMVSFEGVRILGGAYFRKTIFNGDLSFKAAILNRVAYLGETTIRGNFNCKEIRIREGLNLIGLNVEKNLVLERAKIQGFLGMNGISVGGDANLKKLSIVNLKNHAGTISGDVYLQKAKINGSVEFSEAFIEGVLDLRDITIGGSLNLNQTQINEIFLLKNGVIRGEVKLAGLKYGEKIV